MSVYAESQPSQSSPIEKLTHGRWEPMWSIRLYTGMAMLPCFLAMVVFRSGALHGFLVAMTFGVLVGLLVETFEAPANN